MKFEHQIPSDLRRRILHVMRLTGCEVHNTVRPQATTVGFNFTRQDDNRDVMSINVRRIPSSWPKLARMGVQLPEECRCALEEDLVLKEAGPPTAAGRRATCVDKGSPTSSGAARHLNMRYVTGERSGLRSVWY